MFDPFAILTGGVGWFNNTTGTRDRSYQVFDSASGGTFGKAAGLGDLEALCDEAPIEIGNYVWKDLNGNGIQDPNEPPIPGVAVSLYSDPDGIPNNGDEVLLPAPPITTASGQYLFNGLQPNTHYIVAINPNQIPLNGLQPTVANAGGNTNDTIDSDGVLQTSSGPLNGQVTVALTTGNPGDNNHTYDFGFLDICTARCDVSNDGVIDKNDISAIIANRGKIPVAPDFKGECYIDGVISINDAWKCVNYCTRPGCAP